MVKSFQIRVRGKVQGVFYRHSAQIEARRLGLTGFARNESDGSVYIEAEGEEQALNQFVEWCKVEPSSARVDEVTYEEQQPKGISGFDIN